MDAAGTGVGGDAGGVADGDDTVVSAIVADPATGPRETAAGSGGAHRRAAGRWSAIAGRLRPSDRQRSYLFVAAAALLLLALVTVVGLTIPRHTARPSVADLPGGVRPAPTPHADPPAGSGSPAGPTPTAGRTGSPAPSAAPSSPGSGSDAAPAPPGVAAPAVAAPPPSSAAPSPSPWTSLTVAATKVLRRGDSVQTNGIRLSMRQDGNLAVTDENGATRWTSGTAGSGLLAVFQSDGNLVVYDGDAHAQWTSRTEGHDGAVLVLQSDGDVCVVYRGGSLWCAATAH